MEDVRPTQPPQKLALTPLLVIASITVVIHLLVGNRYGFHRDELQFLDDARHLDWGFVTYPPMTSFAARISTALFGISPLAMRLPANLLSAVNILLTAFTARELGGRKGAQVFAALMAVATQLILGSMMEYVVFDYFAWTAVAFCLARLLRTQNERWWLGVGFAFGCGALSKYSIAFLAVSVLGGLLAFPSQWGHFRSRWLYLGTLTALVMAAPNLIWETRHGWVTLKLLAFIHARDVRIGRTAGFLPDQLKFLVFALPFVIAGLFWLARSPRFRVLLCLYVLPLVLFLLSKGRGYYLLPAYTVLYAAGAVAADDWWLTLSCGVQRIWRSIAATLLLLDACVLMALMLPVARIGSPFFLWQLRHSSDLRSEMGWEEMVRALAQARDSLPTSERDSVRVLADNYGEASAVMLYGPKYHLPPPISTVNSYYLRGYGNAPDSLLVIGTGRRSRERLFRSCEVAGQIQIPYALPDDYDDESQPIYVCRGLRFPWPELWAHEQRFG